MTLGQETRWAYSIMLPSPRGVKQHWNVTDAHFDRHSELL